MIIGELDVADSVVIAVVDPKLARRVELVELLGQQSQSCFGVVDVQHLCDDLRVPQIVLTRSDSRAELEEVLEGLGQNERLTAVPVLVLEDEAGALTAAEAFALGAADWVAHGAATTELSSRIKARIERYHTLSKLHHRHQSAALVLELTQALSSTLELRDILFLVVRRIAEVVEVDRVSIVLGGSEDNTGYVIAASDDVQLRDLPITITDYPEIGKTLETGEPLEIQDARDHPLLALAHAPNRFRSLTLFPILFEDRPMGVLFLRGEQPRSFDEDEMFLLRAVANATGIALRNARLLQSLREQSRQSRFAHFEAEQQLKVVQNYVDFFNSSADGILVVSLDGRVLFCNPAACTIVGRDQETLSRESFAEMLTHDGRVRFRDIQGGFAEGQYPHNVDLPIRTPDGERRVLNVSFNRTFREQTGVIVSLRDVSTERAMERELTRTKEFLQRVIDNSVDAIVSANMRGNVLLFNPAAERTYGYDAANVVGKMDVRNLYPNGVALEIMRLIRSDEHGEPGVLQGYETSLLAMDGSLVPVLLSAALIVHRDRPIGSVGVFRDLRAKRQIEAHLAQTKKELLVQEKKALVAELAGATAHELNQPLTAIMGYAELIVRRVRDTDSNLERVSGRIVGEAERMAEIVQKIGKLTKYETKPYVGDTKIIDIDRSIDNEPPVTGY